MHTIDISETEYCKLAVHYSADAEDIDLKRREVVKQFQKAKVPGNRPGKASSQAVEMHYHHQINDSVKRALTEEAYHNTLIEHEIKPFGMPTITDMFLMGHKFSCDFTLNKQPTVTLGQYKGFEIPTPHVPETIDTIAQATMQDLRVRFGDTQPYTESDFVQTTDTAIINYQAFDGDVQVEGLSAEGEIVTIGSTGLHGFDDNMLGMKVGEERDFTLHIPKTGLPSVAGKDIRFHVTLVMGSKNIPAGLDDAFAKKVGKSSYQELLDAVTQYASLQHAEMLRSDKVKQLAARLLDTHDIVVPSWLSLSEAQYLTTSTKLDWNTMSETDKEHFLTAAERNVKLSLILDKIRSEEPEAQLSDTEVLEIVGRNYNRTPGKSSEDMLQELNRTGQLSVLAARVRDEHTLDFLLKHTIFTE